MATWEGSLVRGPPELGAQEAPHSKQAAGAHNLQDFWPWVLGSGLPLPPLLGQLPAHPQAKEGGWDLFQEVPHPSLHWNPTYTPRW